MNMFQPSLHPRNSKYHFYATWMTITPRPLGFVLVVVLIIICLRDSTLPDMFGASQYVSHQMREY